MPHIPSKDEMIRAVRKSNCQNLKDLPLESMPAESIYTHLMEAECPCLKRLLASKSRPHKSKEEGTTRED